MCFGTGSTHPTPMQLIVIFTCKIHTPLNTNPFWTFWCILVPCCSLGFCTKADLFKADFGNEHGHLHIYFDMSKLLWFLLKNVPPRPDMRGIFLLVNENNTTLHYFKCTFMLIKVNSCKQPWFWEGGGLGVCSGFLFGFWGLVVLGLVLVFCFTFVWKIAQWQGR